MNFTDLAGEKKNNGASQVKELINSVKNDEYTKWIISENKKYLWTVFKRNLKTLMAIAGSFTQAGIYSKIKPEVKPEEVDNDGLANN